MICIDIREEAGRALWLVGWLVTWLGRGGGERTGRKVKV